MNKTNIEWVKNPDGSQGYTWNPITGCLNGCSYCYARKLAEGRLRDRYLVNTNIAPPMSREVTPYHTSQIVNVLDPFYPRFWEDRISQPLREQKNSGIFVCDMGELFGDWVPKDWQEWIFSVIKSASWHRFYLLTKQPQNLAKFSPFPENCWVGVTAITNAHLLLAIGQLEKIQARVKFLSLEPMLYELDGFKFAIKDSCIQWVIIGGQSGKEKFYPLEERIQEIESACDKAKIPVFEKDNLRKVWDRMPRQEMP